MIDFTSFTLENGLSVYVHPDRSSSIAVLNILYKVGSRNESEDKTGFAHLFEHLMFGGSKNIANYDEPLQRVGGDNNAFTTTDFTNYYLTLPASNIETGFWLESDRMMSLSFDPKVLEVQRKVVIEEFKQRYLNQPYGDVWHELRKLAFTTHPYKWPVIGRELSHIEQATMDDVKGFFHEFYQPANAILTVAGNIDPDEVHKLSEKWFGPIAPTRDINNTIPKEPIQTSFRSKFVKADVPQDAIFMAFHMPGKFDPGFASADLLSDILGRGNSSRLYKDLVLDKQIFTTVSSHVLGSVDPGLLVIQGKINAGVSYHEAEECINRKIENLLNEGISPEELTKVKNKAISTLEFGQVEDLERAMAISFAAAFNSPDFVNREAGIIENITLEEVELVAKDLLSEDNQSTLFYGNL